MFAQLSRIFKFDAIYQLGDSLADTSDRKKVPGRELLRLHAPSFHMEKHFSIAQLVDAPMASS